MAATKDEVGALHELVAQKLKDELQKEGEDVDPMKVLNAAIKFLKDNGVVAVDGESEALQELKEQVREKSLGKFDPKDIHPQLKAVK